MFKEQAFEIYFSKFPDEERLARAFFECFNVSYGRKDQHASVWFLEPQNQVKQRFGLDREIPVFYSHFPKSDARITKEFEKADRRSDFHDRADRLICILIHQGDEDDIVSVLSQYDRRVVICFTVNELRDPSRSALFIRQRLASKLGQEDLFGMSSPLRNDIYLFGRDELVQTLTTRLVTRHEH